MIFKFSAGSLDRSRIALRDALREYAWGAQWRPAPRAPRKTLASEGLGNKLGPKPDSWGPRMPWPEPYFRVK